MFSKTHIIFTIFSLVIFGALFLFIESVDLLHQNIRVQPLAVAENNGRDRMTVGVVVNPERDSIYGKKSIFQRNYVKESGDQTYYIKEILENYGIDHEVILREDIGNETLGKYGLVIMAGEYDPSDLSKIENYIGSGGIILALPQFLRSADTSLTELIGIRSVNTSYNGNKVSGIRYLKILGSGLNSDKVWGIRPFQSEHPRDVILQKITDSEDESDLNDGKSSSDHSRTGGEDESSVSIGKLLDDNYNEIGAALIVNRIGDGAVVSVGLDIVNAIAFNRHPKYNDIVNGNASENMNRSVDAEAFFKNLIEFSFDQKGIPLIYKWPHQGGVLSTVYDRDDIDTPKDYRNVNERNKLRQKYGVHGTTYIRVAPSSGLRAVISKKSIDRWEAAGSQIALHSEFNSEAIRKMTEDDQEAYGMATEVVLNNDVDISGDADEGGQNTLNQSPSERDPDQSLDSNALRQAFEEKKAAEGLFGKRTYDEVAHGAEGNFKANYWEVATRAGFLSDGYGGMLPTSGYVIRLPSENLGFTLYAIPKHGTLESSFYKETKTLYENAKARGMYFGFLSHSVYLHNTEGSVKKYFMNGTHNALQDLYQSFSVDDVATLTAEEIRNFEDKRRDSYFKYFVSKKGHISILDEESDGIYSAVRGRFPGADKYVEINSESYSLFDGPAEFQLQLN